MQLEIPNDFVKDGEITLRTRGDCMTDTFPDSSELIIKNRGLYSPGDVVVFARRDDALVAHRLLGYLPGHSGLRVLTRADNTHKADAPVALSRVLGHIVQKNGVSLKTPFTVRITSGLAYFPAVISWLQQRLATQEVSV